MNFKWIILLFFVLLPLRELVTLNNKLPLYGHTDSENRGRNIVITGNFNRKWGLVNLLPEAKHSDGYRSHHRDLTNLISFSGEGTIRADRIKPPQHSRVFAQGSVCKDRLTAGQWQGHLSCCGSEPLQQLLSGEMEQGANPVAEEITPKIAWSVTERSYPPRVWWQQWSTKAEGRQSRFQHKLHASPVRKDAKRRIQEC